MLTFNSFSQKHLITIATHFLVPLSVVSSIMRETNVGLFSLPVASMSFRRLDLKDWASTLYVSAAAFVRLQENPLASYSRIMKCFRDEG